MKCVKSRLFLKEGRERLTHPHVELDDAELGPVFGGQPSAASAGQPRTLRTRRPRSAPGIRVPGLEGPSEMHFHIKPNLGETLGLKKKASASIAP